MIDMPTCLMRRRYLIGFGEKSIMCDAKNFSIDMHRYHQEQLMGFGEKSIMCDAKSSTAAVVEEGVA